MLKFLEQHCGVYHELKDNEILSPDFKPFYVLVEYKKFEYIIRLGRKPVAFLCDSEMWFTPHGRSKRPYIGKWRIRSQVHGKKRLKAILRELGRQI